MALNMQPVALGWDSKHRTFASHCAFCALQCALKLKVEAATNRVVRTWGRRDFPTSRGLSCVKGQNAHLQISHPDRLLTPRIRGKDGRLRECGWGEALDFAASRLAEIQRVHGRDRVALFGGGALSNETAYLLGKFARVALRTPHVDYNGRFCMSSAAAAQNATLGVDRGLSFPLADVMEARGLLIVGANLAECLPPIHVFVKRARKRGARLLVADPRRTVTAQLAEIHLRNRPGSDLALGLALLAEVIRAGGIDRAYLSERTTGWEGVEASLAGLDAAWGAARTGVPARDLVRAAGILAATKPMLILTGRGAEQHTTGVDAVQAFLNLALGLGQVGRFGGGYGTLTGQGNGQGGREHGQKCDQLPGYRSIEDPADRAFMAAQWGVVEESLPGKGLSAQEILGSVAEGTVKGLWVMGSNPAVSAPHGSRVRAGLERLEFLAVSDSFPSETAGFAHVVFPVTVFAEEDGTMTNIEGRCVLRRAGVPSPGESRPDTWILSEMAKRLGAGGQFDYAGPEAIFRELAQVTRGSRADYSGMNYSKLDRNKGLFWPCPSVEHPGTPRLFEKRFFHPDGLAHLRPVAFRAEPEAPDTAFPLRLTTGRVLSQYLSGNQTRRLEPLRALAPEPFVEVAPETAQAHGLGEGERAWVETRRGRAAFAVRLAAGMDPGTLFVPFHWGDEKSANLLTQETLDPVSKMPEFKNCAARLSAAEGKPSC